MKLYLVRHGEATTADVDPRKPLSARGEKQIEAVAGMLKPLGLSPAEVWHSTKARAEGTARILRGCLSGAPDLLERRGLGPNEDTAPVAADINAFDGDLMVVGHLPFAARLASQLLFGTDAAPAFLFHTGTTACLDRDAEGRWALEWMVHPAMAGAES